ncbi:hypothetical protein TNCV_20101, partial [Trichonephila clavipes]
SYVNPTPLAHADASRDVLPRGGTSHISDNSVLFVDSRFGSHGLDTIIVTSVALFRAILTEQTLIISTPLEITLTTRKWPTFPPTLELELALSQRNSTRDSITTAPAHTM